MKKILLTILSLVILASCQEKDVQKQPVEVKVKDYYKEEIDKTKATLLSLTTEPCLVFPMVTDIHYLATTSMRPELIDDTIDNMIAISKDIRFDFMACLGDLTQGDKAMSETEKEVAHVYSQFKRLGLPFYTCIGNHDTNIYYKVNGSYQKDHVFSLTQQYGLYIKDIYDVVFDDSMSKTNYYKDFDSFNIRCIFLNSNEGDDYGFTDETLAWFTEVMNTGHDVYVFSHRNPATSSSYHNQNEMTAVMKNASNFKMLFYGHVHYDCEFTAPFTEDNPILAFAQNANKCYNHDRGEGWPDQAVLPERKVDSADEDCFDVVVIRPQSGKVNLVRFGAGVDREFDLRTGMSTGESSNMTEVAADLELKLDFSSGWPFVEPCASKTSQTAKGEEYTYKYAYEVDGAQSSKEVKFVLYRGKMSGFTYSYVEPTQGNADGCLAFENYVETGDGSTYGLLSIPYIEGMYLKSVSVTHSDTSSHRFNIQKGFSITTDYSPAVYVKKNTIKTWDFPLESTGGVIAPGIGTATSGLRDYAIRMRSNNVKLKKATFSYTKTKPE